MARGVAAWFLLAGVAGCGALIPRAVPDGALRAGTPVSALPPGYGLVLGKVQVTVGGEPLRCAAVRAPAACGLVVRYETGETFLIPHQPPESLAAYEPPGPFFAIRLPEGAYEVTRFDVPREALGPGVPELPGAGIPLGNRFTVPPGGFVYVGSLYADVDPGAAGGVFVRVVDERGEAGRVAEEIDPVAAPRLRVQLLE